MSREVSNPVASTFVSHLSNQQSCF